MINHEIEANISTITLDNARNYNAFSETLTKDFINILNDIDKHKEIKLVVLKAAGQNFSSGADLNLMQSMSQSPKDVNKKDAYFLATLLDKLNTLTKPTIALVQGRTYGGALGLLACCDIVIAETNAQFCFSEVKLGLIPATIAPYIVQCIGNSAARRYFLTAETFDAEKAKDLGLVHVLCKPAQLEKTAESVLQQLKQNGPEALQAVKQLIHSVDPIPSALIEETANRLADIRTSKEAQEGISAFLEKRKPTWINND